MVPFLEISQLLNFISTLFSSEMPRIKELELRFHLTLSSWRGSMPSNIPREEDMTLVTLVAILIGFQILPVDIFVLSNLMLLKCVRYLFRRNCYQTRRWSGVNLLECHEVVFKTKCLRILMSSMIVVLRCSRLHKNS